MDAALVESLQVELTRAGAITRFLGIRLGAVKSLTGKLLEADATLENSPSVLFDGMILPGGDRAVQILAKSGQAVEFLKDQYRHGKTILMLDDSAPILDKAGIPKALPSGQPDPGLIVGLQGARAGTAFISALARHRHPERDRDPPAI
jgi:catalase